MSDSINPAGILNNFLKANKSDHYNFEETIDYKVSSGSLQFDMHLGGGFGPGLHRFTGINIRVSGAYEKFLEDNT
jgi:hypothetical protein